jgi:hypothetical protein
MEQTDTYIRVIVGQQRPIESPRARVCTPTAAGGPRPALAVGANGGACRLQAWRWGLRKHYEHSISDPLRLCGCAGGSRAGLPACGPYLRVPPPRGGLLADSACLGPNTAAQRAPRFTSTYATTTPPPAPTPNHRLLRWRQQPRPQRARRGLPPLHPRPPPQEAHRAALPQGEGRHVDVLSVLRPARAAARQGPGAPAGFRGGGRGELRREARPGQGARPVRQRAAPRRVGGDAAGAQAGGAAVRAHL